jgi:hypothetical protein
VLPRGSCVLWGGGPTLATVLAADRRSVLLIEPRIGDREEAARRAGPGVLVQGPDALDDDTTADSVVVIAGTEGPSGLEAVLARPVGRTAALAVVTDADGEAAVSGALQAAGREVLVARNHLRMASTLAFSEPEPTTSPLVRSLGDGAGFEPSAVVVLASVDVAPSVAIGADAGPAAWWSDTLALQHTLEELDEQLTASHVTRERELEQALADVEQRWHDAEQRLAALLASTSWRVTGPLRRASDIVKRR